MTSDGDQTGFLSFFGRLGGVDAFGFPKTGAREDLGNAGMLLDPGSVPGFIRQYFQAAVFQLNARGEVELTLLGDTLRDRLVPDHATQGAFRRGDPFVVGQEIYPVVMVGRGRVFERINAPGIPRTASVTSR